MAWLPYAIACSFIFALQSAYIKKLLAQASVYLVTWGAFVGAIPFVVGVQMVSGVPAIAPSFYWAFSLDLVINMMALTLYVRAIQVSPLSLTIPFLAFTPVFLLLTGRLILGETPSLLGITGILLVVAGAYAINLDQVSKGVLVPLLSIWRNRGSALMLLVAFLWSLASTLDKIAVRSSSPVFYSAAFHAAFAVFYLPILFVSCRRSSVFGTVSPWSLLTLGALQAAFVIPQMIAVRIALVSYVIAVKRAGMVFSVLFGVLFFHERHPAARLVGSLLMVAGVFCIALGK
jgi:drug/metabolite transporter (DMT)-like permease